MSIVKDSTFRNTNINNANINNATFQNLKSGSISNVVERPLSTFLNNFTLTNELLGCSFIYDELSSADIIGNLNASLIISYHNLKIGDSITTSFIAIEPSTTYDIDLTTDANILGTPPVEILPNTIVFYTLTCISSTKLLQIYI